MEKRNDYIEWMFRLEPILRQYNIEISEYDEFHINDAIETTERMLKEYNISSSSSLNNEMIDSYVSNAIEKNPSKKDYYETVSFYIKKRLSHDNTK